MGEVAWPDYLHWNAVLFSRDAVSSAARLPWVSPCSVDLKVGSGALASELST